MRIGIDISQIVYRTGVSRYTTELVKHLLEIDKKNQYVLFGSSLRLNNQLKSFVQNLKSKNTLSAIFPIPPTVLEIFFNRIRLGDIQNLIGKVDIFHSSDWTQSKTSAKKVTTVHDLAVFKFPELFHPKIVAVQKRRFELVKRECDKIIAVSQNTKKDLIEILKIPEDKITVIYEAASELFKTKDKSEIEKVKKRFSIEGSYILTIATGGARKNLSNLVEAFKKIINGKSQATNNLKLVVVGQAENLESSNSIILTGFLDDNDLASLYSGSKVFVYPSIYEGFGLPILEAMACGSQVACSDISVHREVAGDVPFYFDPKNPDEIATILKEAINLDNLSCQSKANEGILHAKKYSWLRTAKETLKLYQRLTKS